MAEYKWPEAEKRSLIGKRISRIDGPHKVSGRAKYSLRHQTARRALRQDAALARTRTQRLSVSISALRKRCPA